MQAGAELLVVKLFLDAELVSCAALPFARPGPALFPEYMSNGLPWTVGAELDPVRLEPNTVLRGTVDEIRMYTGVMTAATAAVRQFGPTVQDSVLCNPFVFALEARGTSPNSGLGLNDGLPPASPPDWSQDWSEGRIPLQLLFYV